MRKHSSPLKSLPEDFHKALEWFLGYIHYELGRSPETLLSYRQALSVYLNWLDTQGLETLDQVQTRHIKTFLLQLSCPEGSDAPAYSRSTVAHRITAVRSFHRHLHAEGLAATDPSADVPAPRLPQRLPHPLSQEKINQLLDYTAHQDAPPELVLRDLALLELLYGTGARASELCVLTEADLPADSTSKNALVRLRGKGDKQRLVPLGKYAWNAVNTYLREGRPLLLRKAASSASSAADPGRPLLLSDRGLRMSRQLINHRITALALKAGLGKGVSPHTLRHSFATHMISGGADVRAVQELLGHASVTTTQIYTAVAAESVRELFFTYHPRAR